jgi:hypothetical protein
MEVMPDGNILVLQRQLDIETKHRVSTLEIVDISQCKNGQLCPSTVLAQQGNDKHWALENLEDLTHLYDNLYLMLSDDNHSPKQQTIAVLFEILPYSD